MSSVVRPSPQQMTRRVVVLAAAAFAIVVPVIQMATGLGLDQGEFVTIPSLTDPALLQRLEAARQALGPELSRNAPAARYGLQAPGGTGTNG